MMQSGFDYSSCNTQVMMQSMEVLDETGFVGDDDDVDDEHGEEDVSSKSIWVDAPTKLLLSLLKEYFPQVGKTMRLKSEKKLWPLVSTIIQEHEYFFNPTQVQNKYRSLERMYKKAKLHNNKTGRNRQKIPYESELDELFGERRGINPEYLLDNEECSGSSRVEAPSAANQISNDEFELFSVRKSPAPKKIKTGTVQGEMLKKLDELQEERMEFHGTIKEYLQRKEEREKCKNERADRKMQLLESIVLQIQN